LFDILREGTIMSDEEHTQPQGPTSPSIIKATSSFLSPVAPKQRISALDILRGFALIGILLMNIEWFSRPISSLGGFDTELTGLDHGVAWLIRCFVEGKFYKLFALLFGMGFAVMLTQAMQKGRPFGAWFSRRMAVLFVFGILHMFFVWQGDILHDYAFTGLLMLGLVYLLRKERFEKYNNSNFILKLALWWLTIPLLLASLAGIGFNTFVDRQSLTEQWQEEQEIRRLVEELEAEATVQKALSSAGQAELTNEKLDVLPNEKELNESDSTKLLESEVNLVELEVDSEAQELTLEEQAQDIFANEQEQDQAALDEITALSQRSFWQATAFRAKTSMMWLAYTPVFAFTLLLPLFLLGYWLVISGLIKDHSQHPKLFGYMARIGLGVGLVVTVGSLTIINHPAVEHIMPIQTVASVLFNGGQFFMAAGYLGLLIRLLDSPKYYKILVKLAPMGRMALTNYIMHSLILTSIFYGYAGGWYGEISRAPQMLLVLAIVLLQIPLSSWWLKHYQFGPLEWLWRSLTYKAWQPFKISPQL
jgi:uncharacterized membrane protein YeiB